MYGRREPEDLFEIMTKYSVSYIILEDSHCLAPARNGCRLPDLVDVDNRIVRCTFSYCFQLLKYYYGCCCLINYLWWMCHKNSTSSTSQSQIFRQYVNVECVMLSNLVKFVVHEWFCDTGRPCWRCGIVYFIYIIFSDGVWPLLIKYNIQPSDWPVYRDLVMTSPYDDVIIHKLQYATTWLVEHTVTPIFIV